MTPNGHRRLILTRHAKSAWDNPQLSDHDRPLNDRGRAAATELGQWLASRDHLPDQILCSDAARTTETWKGIAPALEVVPEAEMLPNLYHASSEAMMRVLKGAQGGCVMMLGHNPGIAEFAEMLPADPPQNGDFMRYPTAATLVVDFQIDSWAALQPHQGSVLDFFTPTKRG